jgi:hypothetical protein
LERRGGKGFADWLSGLIRQSTSPFVGMPKRVAHNRIVAKDACRSNGWSHGTVLKSKKWATTRKVIGIIGDAVVLLSSDGNRRLPGGFVPAKTLPEDVKEARAIE